MSAAGSAFSCWAFGSKVRPCYTCAFCTHDQRRHILDILLQMCSNVMPVQSLSPKTCHYNLDLKVSDDPSIKVCHHLHVCHRCQTVRLYLPWPTSQQLFHKRLIGGGQDVDQLIYACFIGFGRLQKIQELVPLSLDLAG